MGAEFRSRRRAMMFILSRASGPVRVTDWNDNAIIVQEIYRDFSISCGSVAAEIRRHVKNASQIMK